MKRRSLLSGSASLATLGSLGLAGLAGSLPASALAQSGRKQVTLGMALEPPGLDPTAGAASAIAEVSLYNIYETLTKIQSDGSVVPMLAESWEVSPDLRTYTFHLRHGVRFHNGEAFNAHTAAFSFQRAAGDKSTNKDKRTFAQMETIRAVDDHTLVVVNKEIDPDFLFLMGQATAIMVEPRSAETNATRPVGTGPYTLDTWVRGSSLSLKSWNGYRQTQAPRIPRASFRFIADPAAQVAALLAGDVDAFPRVTPRSVAQLQSNPRFQVKVSGSRAPTSLAI